MGSLRTLRKTATQQELHDIAYQLDWQKRQLLMGMADGVRLIDSPPDSAVGYDGAMYPLCNDELIKGLLRLLLIEERHGPEYFLTSLGSTVSRFVRNRPYQYLVLHLKPGTIFEEPKWNEERGLVDTGRLARQEIFSCVSKGILPSGNYRCRTSQKRNRYGGEERTICVSVRLPDVPHDLTHLNDVVCTLEGILWQYTRRREGACSEISFSICFLAD